MSEKQEGITIHPTAVVAETANIGKGTVIGPYTVIGPHVTLGENNTVGSHVVIEGRTIMGDGNRVFQFASVGADPQDLKFEGEESRLEIGNNNIIREYVTLQPGTRGGEMVTRIGNKNLFMVSAHIGHDCIVGDDCKIANCTAIGGHVEIGSHVVISGLVGIHQFTRLGDYAMLGGGAMVVKDIPPFCMAQGDRAQLIGINQIALERSGVDAEQIKLIRKAFRKLFIASGSFEERFEAAKAMAQDSTYVNTLVDFIAKSERGITPARKKDLDDR